mmetsp:Transcript_69/g.92  ORF Transcript_69/g.92 Transcript_69/m.92 type:complete len:490 (-) Transcript_69:3-1472(-)
MSFSAAFNHQRERSYSPSSLRSDDSSSSSSVKRSMKGILDRLRGNRRDSKHKEKERASTLDVFQNMRLRSRGSSSHTQNAASGQDDMELDDVTSATTATTFASSQAFSQMPFSPGQSSTHQILKPRTGLIMRTQNHTAPSLYSSGAHKYSGKINNLKSCQGQQRSSRSPRRGGVRKKVRTEPCNALQGLNPLYNAVSSGAPRHVLETMLGENPQASFENHDNRMIPLHCAIERYDTDLDTLRLLLDSNFGAAATPGPGGSNSVDLLWKRFVNPDDYRHKNEKVKASALRSAIQEICDPNFVVHRQSRAQHALLGNEELKAFWDLICDFIYAGCYGESPDEVSIEHKRKNLLFDCVGLDCNPLLIQFAAALYPDQLKNCNHQGQLPLHTAAMKCSRTIEILVDLFPRAAFMPDGSGRLPLHLALDNKMASWDGIKSLVFACPKSLCSEDPVTGLLPVLQAAATDGIDLTTIYSLLAENPMEVMNYALQRD